TRRLPVISDLAGRSTSLLDLASTFGSNKTAQTLGALRSIRAQISAVNAAQKDGAGSKMNLGSYELNGSSSVQSMNNAPSQWAERGGNSGNNSSPVAKPGPAKNFFNNIKANSVGNKSVGSFKLDFPILTEPRLLVDAIFFKKYKDITLVTLQLPHFEFNFQY